MAAPEGGALACPSAHPHLLVVGASDPATQSSTRRPQAMCFRDGYRDGKLLGKAPPWQGEGKSPGESTGGYSGFHM
jgi:hypothetical protein